MTTTLFYPLAALSPWQDNELRYSLRSFEQYATIDRVIICGHKPDWLTNVEHIPYVTNLHYNKPREIMHKATMCHAPEFIFCNDDIFLLQPLTDLPNYYSVPLSQAKYGSETYRKYIAKTYYLYEYGFYFDIHAPMVMESAKLAKLPPVMDVLFKSHYGNYHCLEQTPLEDFKINRYMRAEEIDHVTTGRPFLSIGDNALSPDMKAWLQNRFPNKSKYEI